jgi:putative methionine-R-sulfoxide reductase with GAF domain
MEIPLERGLTGWVAENRKPIANGNPAVESGYNRDRLRSALSVPLESGDLLVGALTLYSMSINAFSAEDLHLMMAASSIFAAALAGTAIRGGQIKTPVPARKSDFLATPAFSLQPGPQPLIQ